MAQDNDKNLFKEMKWIGWGGAALTAVILVLFLLNQTYSTDLPVDTGIFGTYGDFIGGVLGTIVALYSAYLLIRTLDNQSRVNKSVKETNESIISANKKADAAAQQQYYQNALQIFDGKFSRFFEAYQKAISAYEHAPLKGKAAFERIARFFIDGQFENNNDYKRRCGSATDDYLEFYAEYQTEMSVHFRMLYLLVTLIAKSELEECDKVEYAKLVRGQMSNAEMLIVRYNCRSPYGEKMQTYCNQYNLTKHLSVISLLEFKAYRNAIEQGENEERKKWLSGLDIMFITLRKKATRMLYDETPSSDRYKTSHTYTIKMDCTAEDKQTFVLEIKKAKGVVRRGGGMRVSPDEYALDCLDNNMLINMIKDFMSELFVESNFGMYNDGIDIRQQGNAVDNDQEFSFKIIATNNKRLVLSYIQMKMRDNPVGALE